MVERAAGGCGKCAGANAGFVVREKSLWYLGTWAGRGGAGRRRTVCTEQVVIGADKCRWHTRWHTQLRLRRRACTPRLCTCE